MTTRRDSLTDYQHWQERVWQEMAEILRDRLRAVGASDEDILYFRPVPAAARSASCIAASGFDRCVWLPCGI